MTPVEFHTIRRDCLGLSGVRLATLFGVTRRTVRRYESQDAIPQVVILLMTILRDHPDVRHELMRTLPPRPRVGRPRKRRMT